MVSFSYYPILFFADLRPERVDACRIMLERKDLVQLTKDAAGRAWTTVTVFGIIEFNLEYHNVS
jgi:hypothetical protein